MSAIPLVEMTGITVDFGHITAVEDVDFRLHGGAIDRRYQEPASEDWLTGSWLYTYSAEGGADGAGVREAHVFDILAAQDGLVYAETTPALTVRAALQLDAGCVEWRGAWALCAGDEGAACGDAAMQTCAETYAHGAPSEGAANT